MLLFANLRRLIFRSPNGSRKRLKRIETFIENDGVRYRKPILKVYQVTHWDRILRFNFQGFTYWPNSSHFSDILGKYRFLKMDDNDHDEMRPPVSDLLNPPKDVARMKMLDRSAFRKKCQFPGIKVPSKSVGKISRKLKSSLLRIPKLKSVADLEDDDQQYSTHKLLLLDPVKYRSLDDIDEHETQILKEQGVDLESFQHYDIELCYDNWSASDILRAVLPSSSANISGFSIIGHIAHLNLKEDVLDFKNLIGEVILDKNPTVRTVVNKTNEIDTTFRFFKMEILAGENDMMTQVKEHGFVYEFDFSKVYWNPRLATEHQRVIDEVKEGDIVYDVFAGVGPFAIPAAKKMKAIVYANDLNPNSYDSLCKNIALNKVKTEIKCSNLDGREFIRTVLKTDMVEWWKNDREMKGRYRVVMNLPALAIEFTDAFRGLFVDVDDNVRPSSPEMMPYMYVYCFSKSQTPEADVKQRLELSIGSPLPESHIIRRVRNVAPGKEMLCICFLMPAEVLFNDSSNDDDSSAAKKRKIDDIM